jgi:peptide/nickel transport system ATP-binding protein
VTALLEIRGLEVDLGERSHPTHVLRGVELQVGPGEVVGMVGESGCGKTTAMLAVVGLLPANARVLSGSISFAGRDLLKVSGREWRTIRGREVACVFQNARNALHPMMSVGRQIARLHRLHWRSSEKTAWRETVATLEQAGLADAERIAHRCAHELSGGQCQRAMIAMALIGRPKLLLADEPTSGLDVTVQRHVLATLLRNVREHETAMILISHDIGVVRRTCDRVNVMYAGEVVESGPRSAVLDSPAHPYTRSLLGALVPRGRRMSYIPGRVPDLRNAIDACSFADRCTFVVDACRAGRPSDAEIERDHRARCIRVDAARDSPLPVGEARC